MHLYAGTRVLLLIDNLFLHNDFFFTNSTLMCMKFVLVINFERCPGQMPLRAVLSKKIASFVSIVKPV